MKNSLALFILLAFLCSCSGQHKLYSKASIDAANAKYVKIGSDISPFIQEIGSPSSIREAADSGSREFRYNYTEKPDCYLSITIDKNNRIISTYGKWYGNRNKL